VLTRGRATLAAIKSNLLGLEKIETAAGILRQFLEAYGLANNGRLQPRRTRRWATIISKVEAY